MMEAIVEFDPSRPSGEGRVPGAVKRRKKLKHIVSETSRALILQEFGIDAQAAEEAYHYHREARKNRAARKDEQARRQVGEELRRRAEEVAEARGAEQEAAPAQPILTTEDVTDTTRTLIFTAFILLGLAGFLSTFLSPPAWVTWGVSGLVAAITCGYLLNNRETEIPFPILSNFLKV